MRKVLIAGLLAASVASPALAAQQTQAQRFASAVAKDSLAEIALGHLALEKSGDPQVKDFATMLIDDHTKANATLKSIAQEEKITLPDQPGEKLQKPMSKLSKLKGKEFDRAYAKDMVADYKEARLGRAAPSVRAANHPGSAAPPRRGGKVTKLSG